MIVVKKTNLNLFHLDTKIYQMLPFQKKNRGEGGRVKMGRGKGEG